MDYKKLLAEFGERDSGYSQYIFQYIFERSPGENPYTAQNMINVPMQGTTITHEIIGVCGGSEVLLKPASDGTGVIAAGPVRAVCDGAGIRNILTKCHRSNNPINVVKATFDGLTRLKSV